MSTRRFIGLAAAALLLAACGAPPATEVAPLRPPSPPPTPPQPAVSTDRVPEWRHDRFGRWHRPPVGSRERARIDALLDGAAPALLERVERIAVGAAIWYDIDACRYTGLYDVARARNEPRMTVKMFFDCGGWNDSVQQPFTITVGMPLRLALDGGEWVLE